MGATPPNTLGATATHGFFGFFGFFSLLRAAAGEDELMKV